MQIRMTLLAVVAALLPTNAFAEEPQVNAGDVAWTYPPASYAGASFSRAFRYKTLIGSARARVEGQNVFFGEAEFAPGAIYVGHNHPAPEIYYVISGEAEWTVDGQTFLATPGTAIYTKPYAVHRMVNVGESVLKTVWMWWGDPEVLQHYPELTEPIEEQPAKAKFAE